MRAPSRDRSCSEGESVGSEVRTSPAISVDEAGFENRHPSGELLQFLQHQWRSWDIVRTPDKNYAGPKGDLPYRRDSLCGLRKRLPEDDLVVGGPVELSDPRHFAESMVAVKRPRPDMLTGRRGLEDQHPCDSIASTTELPFNVLDEQVTMSPSLLFSCDCGEVQVPHSISEGLRRIVGCGNDPSPGSLRRRANDDKRVSCRRTLTASCRSSPLRRR